MSLTVEKCLVEGKSVRAIRLAAAPRDIGVAVDGQSVAAAASGDTIVLDKPIDLRAGRRIAVTLKP